MVQFAGQVVLNPVAVAELLRGDQGPVVRRLLEDGEIVKQGGRRRVGVSKPDPVPRRGRRRQPGTLRDSIVKRLVHRGTEVVCQVGSEDPIALLHHEGTQPHAIPLVGEMPDGKWLVFAWERAGGAIVHAKKVDHPGTRPNRFLTDSLADLRGRYT